MRLYYGCVTLTACWAGWAASGRDVAGWQSVAVLLVGFLGWGINQIVNDYMGRAEDRVNAPRRPMVSGELAAVPALVASLGLDVVALGVAFVICPASVWPLVAGVVLNIAYSYAKGYGVWGNLVFGLAISCCTWFGYVAGGGGLWEMFASGEARSVWLVVVAINMAMTHYTYFKDRKGDAAAGKRTLVVMLGVKRAGRLGMVIAVAVAYLLVTGMLGGGRIAEGQWPSLWTLVATLAAAGLFILTGWLFLGNIGAGAYYSRLKYNFAAASAAQAALVARFYPQTGFWLALASVAFVTGVFHWGYRDAKE